MASITSYSITVSYNGTGSPEVQITAQISVRGSQIPYFLNRAELALSPEEDASLLSVMTAVLTRAHALAVTDFTLP